MCLEKRYLSKYIQGDKISKTGRVKLERCTAYFNKKLTLSMTMNFNPEQQGFEYKKVNFL